MVEKAEEYLKRWFIDARVRCQGNNCKNRNSQDEQHFFKQNLRSKYFPPRRMQKFRLRTNKENKFDTSMS